MPRISPPTINPVPSAEKTREPTAGPPTQPRAASSGMVLRVLYLYAGEARKAELGTALNLEASRLSNELHGEFSVVLEEHDILRGQKSDLSNISTTSALLQRIKDGFYDLIIASPPCETFSRVKFQNKLGPAPIRSFEHPKGFPWLSAADKASATTANAHISFSVQALAAAAEAGAFGLLEHPEDLGINKLGWPASIWQWEECKDLQAKSDYLTGALHQCNWHTGLGYAKPTRFMTNVVSLANALHLGWPKISSGGAYIGLLPRHCGHVHEGLAMRKGDASFRTTGTAAYPWGMCEKMSALIWSDPNVRLRLETKLCTLVKENQQSPASRTPSVGVSEPTSSTGGVITAGPSSDRICLVPKAAPLHHSPCQEEDPTSDEDSEGEQKAKLGEGWWGRGKPMMVHQGANHQEQPLEDGAGLCSPGRWAIKDRNLPQEFSDAVLPKMERILEHWGARKYGGLKRLVFVMATGKLKDSPFPAMVIRQLKDVVKTEVARITGSKEWGTAVDQPIDVRFLQQALKATGDPDYKILNDYAQGVRLGYRRKMPRTPAVFQRKKEWRLSQDEEDVSWPPNYKSSMERKSGLQEQFEEDEKAGMMGRCSFSEAKKKLGGESPSRRDGGSRTRTRRMEIHS